MQSIWHKLKRPEARPALEGRVSTDVLVIGGGIAGILCAHMLKEAGVSCLVVESGRICDGVSGNTTAKVTIQHGLIYDTLVARFGHEWAYLYSEAAKRALADYARLAERIDCDFERRDSYVYLTKRPSRLEREVAAMRGIGIKAELCETPSLPIPTVGAVRVREQAQIHPLKLLYPLARGLEIYENTRVTELAEGLAKTERGEIAFKSAVIATHFPILNKHGVYFLKMYQHRSYFLSLRGRERVGGMYVDGEHTGMSFRDYEGEGERALLIGGGGHRTGKRGGAWSELEALAREQYPTATVTHKWAAQDCMTLDGMPYIGRYSSRTKGLYVATGFNKWGMTSSMVAARLLCDLILERDNDYAAVFSPSRSILHPQLALNTFETVLNLITPTAPRCPHLGCALKYNRAEHSWDCPCHGSRFDVQGKLLDGPATADKQNLNRRNS